MATKPLANLVIVTSGTDDTMPGGHLTNLQFMMPDPHNPGSSYSPTSTALLHDDYLSEFLLASGSRFPAARLMDLMQTNGSHITNWSDVYLLSTATVTPYSYCAGTPGIPWDVMLGVVSALQIPEIWVCVPHLATDACVTSFFTFLRDNWPGTIYVEYSNEVWNTAFAQFTYAVSQGFPIFAAPGTVQNSSTQYDPAMKWYGRRSYQVEQLGRAVFASDANPSRYKSVVAGAASHWGVTQYLTDSGGPGPDFVSTNGYYGGR